MVRVLCWDMQLVERIEVRKIFIGSAFKFGLLYGLIIGLIFGIIALVMEMAGYSTGNVFTGGLLPIEGIFIVSGVVFLFYVILGIVGAVFGALIYNLVAVMGGKIHIGLAEYEKAVDSMQAAKVTEKVSSKVAVK
jgi:hypothetical protein